MTRPLLAFCIILFLGFGVVHADPIVATSQTLNVWLDHGLGPWIQLTLAYFRVEGGIYQTTLVGDNLWFSTPNSYDFSGDPELPEFLNRATNGTNEELLLSLSDQHVANVVVPFPELFLLGSFPDLAPLQITAAHLIVERIEPSPDGILLAFHMEYAGVPEPSALAMFYSFAAGYLLIARQRSCAFL